jgi:two-component system, response regulator / RNA-binding antiterminator
LKAARDGAWLALNLLIWVFASRAIIPTPVHTVRLNIAIIDEDPIRAAILEDGLREAGYSSISLIDNMSELLTRIDALDPDVIVIALGIPSRDVLEQMLDLSRIVRRPVAIFVDQADSASIQAAIDAGVSTYVVDGLRKERVRPILDVTISRFRAFARLQDELAAAKEALEGRKTIERAKGILMKSRGLSEEEAYGLLRKTAMNEKRKLADIARSVVTTAHLLDGR